MSYSGQYDRFEKFVERSRLSLPEILRLAILFDEDVSMNADDLANATGWNSERAVAVIDLLHNARLIRPISKNDPSHLVGIRVLSWALRKLYCERYAQEHSTFNAIAALDQLDEELEICCYAADYFLVRHTYRRTGRWHKVTILPAGGYFAHIQDGGGFYCLNLGLLNPLKWRREVADRGLALVDGQFVFEVFHEINPDTLIALAVQQGAGTTVALSTCLLVKCPTSGEWSLCWQDVPDEFKEAHLRYQSPHQSYDWFLDRRYHQAVDRIMKLTFEENPRLYEVLANQTCEVKTDAGGLIQ